MSPGERGGFRAIDCATLSRSVLPRPSLSKKLNHHLVLDTVIGQASPPILLFLIFAGSCVFGKQACVCNRVRNSMRNTKRG